jgi:hypothetical protein
MPYSKGDLNYLIDSIVHPLYEESQFLRIVDGLLHAAVEQNASLSLKKFVRYNARDLSKKKFESRKRGAR